MLARAHVAPFVKTSLVGTYSNGGKISCLLLLRGLVQSNLTPKPVAGYYPLQNYDALFEAYLNPMTHPFRKQESHGDPIVERG